MLTTLRELLQEAEAHNQAVRAFNVYNLESAQAVLQAAEALDAPVILATSEKALRYGGWRELGALLRTMAERARVPVALHLDHGSSVESVLLALRHGWSSVMLDGSHLPYEENVALTREAVRVAHAVGVSVEGELGEIAGIEDDRAVDEQRARLTDPEQARAFVKATGVDALAVAVGTSHGAYKYRGTPRLDLERLADIHARVPVPLVLHGASGVPETLVQEAHDLGMDIGDPRGVPDDLLREAVRRGIRKVNTDTDLRLAFTVAVRRYLRDHPGVFDPRRILGAAREAMVEVVRHRIQVLRGGHPDDG
ncbi:MAG: class II fructose-bisphosphate aldolase [Candidatus Hydrothermae bacterium]|nr:class II fructose-bisphosphate aldolase [Candidatus Hydrothermae bacterium]